jgi:succinate dehydrogenase / fumarate reductase membrane anchor subunit
VVNVFWHARLGLSELIGDYVHEDGNKIAALLLVNFAAAGGIAFGLFFILKAALGEAAA